MACIYKFQRIKVSAKALPALVLSAMMSLFFIKVYKRSDKSKQGYWRVENKIKKNNIELYIKLEKDDFKMRNKELNLTQFETLSDEELPKNRRWISADTRYARVERPIYSLVVEFEAI